MRHWRRVIPEVLLLTLLLGCKDAFDVQPPQVEILSPPDGAQVVGDVQIIVRAADANLSKVLVYVDDLFVHESTEDSFGFTYTMPDSNKHIVKARATDRRGNWGTASIMVNPVAELQITSTPSGAKVWLDWQETGDTTNCVLTDVKPGQHTVKLTKPGYFDWEDTVTAVYKQRVQVAATLVADIGAILVTSTPTGAAVWIDGRSSGYATNCVVPNVPTGNRIVRLTKTDYYDWEDTVSVALGDTAIVDATLTSNPYPNTVIDSIVFADYSSPWALAWNATNNRLYCALARVDQVAVIDCANNNVVGTVGVGNDPRALVWNETNNRIYSANDSSNNLTVIDGASGAYVTTIAVGHYPRALAWNGTSNRIYCANRDDDSVSVIDGAQNTVVATVAVGDGPRALCFNPQDGKVYCANYNSNSVSVIDGATNSVTATVSVGRGPYALCYNSKNNRVYCANADGGSVSVIDGATNSVITTVGGVGNPTALVWNSANNKVYCTEGYNNDHLKVMDCPTNSVVDSLDNMTYDSYGLAYNALQNRVYVTYSYGSLEMVRVVGAR
ncbi:PEGA domain-containing protein [candidate division WOR-3 bacterium]|uniref:PEGA domain-containing protein n=1 Tax=candidate division WOR-3 bacterium TaxID=2052148 RepID=A0A937XFH0_UNCW3|nr:PEGA domain-containing protein [candidate division WOR-3 bacterium]